MECVSSYRNKPPGLSDSDSSDSDDEGNKGWKRNPQRSCPELGNTRDLKEPTPQVPLVLSDTQPVENNGQNRPKRKVNNIWSSVLQEQAVSEIFKDVALKHKPITLQDRSCESYDFRRKYSDTRPEPDFDEGDMDVDDDCDISKNKVPAAQNISARGLLRIRKQDVLVGRKIARLLGEKKRELVVRVVNVLGVDKAMELLKKTEAVEDEGGMQTKDNSRRRTPGGVYFQLLKNDETISKKQVRVIFREDDRLAFLQAKKRGMIMKKRIKKKRPSSKAKKQTHKAGDMEVVQDESETESISPVPEPSVESGDCEALISPPSDDVGTTEALETVDSEIEDGEILD